MNLDNGGMEDDDGKEREAISVVGFSNVSESVSAVTSLQLVYKQNDWGLVGSWTGISEEEALKLCEEVMVTCFSVAGGGLAELQFPLQTTKQLDHIQGNRYFCLHAFIGLIL